MHGVKYVPGFAGICLFYYSWTLQDLFTEILTSEQSILNDQMFIVSHTAYHIWKKLMSCSLSSSWTRIGFSVVSNVHLEHSIHSNDHYLKPNCPFKKTFWEYWSNFSLMIFPITTRIYILEDRDDITKSYLIIDRAFWWVYKRIENFFNLSVSINSFQCKGIDKWLDEGLEVLSLT